MQQVKPARAAEAPWQGGMPLEDSDDVGGTAEPLAQGVHLAGSVPVGSAEEVFVRAADALGDRLRRIPDGETGPRSDWILWQYPVFSSRPEFEVCPPAASSYRTLPKLKLRPDAKASELRFDSLGYGAAAISSYRQFAELKRDGAIPGHCRFQVSLPTPLAPVSAFVAEANQAELEPVYEAKLLEELGEILAAIPGDQLALQWDARYEFAMLEGFVATWFGEARGGILERLLRLSRAVPGDVELGFHLCYGDQDHGHFVELDDSGKLVAVANTLAASLDRTVNWIHMPAPPGPPSDAFFAPLAELALQPQTELYLGLLHEGEGADVARDRIRVARRYVEGFGIATDCGWGRGDSDVVEELFELHRATSEPLSEAVRGGSSTKFQWPPGFTAVPDEEWARQPLDETALAYDHVDEHGWYDNLDPTVDDLAATLRDGDILLDYSGGTGILLDRLRLRIFGRQVGLIIVDASAKFLRVAAEKYRGDPRVGMRLLRYLRDEKRLENLDEVLDQAILERGVDAIAAANAIHLYPDLDQVAAAWVQALRPGGKVFINSGNLRNPRAEPGEWILDETVWVINDIAEGIVRSDPHYEQYLPVLDDSERMAAHAAHRDRVFMHPRPLEFYTQALSAAGLAITEVREKTIEADVYEWYELMSAYHEPVLGWVGGTKRLDGSDPTPEALDDRLKLMRHAIDTIFAGRATFNACWTYITAVKPA